MKRRDFVRGLLGAGASVGFAGSGLAAPQPSDWPTGALAGDHAVIDRAWAAGSIGAASPIGRSDALVVVQNGRLVYERYGPDHGPATRHVSWSMAKSFTQALVGIGVLDGRVDIDAPLKSVAHPDPNLSLRRLLTMTDGLAWRENDYRPVSSDATRMLYGPGRLNGAAYVARRRQAYPPGEHWNYSTGAYQLAAAELQLRLFPDLHAPAERRAAMAGWIRQRLFQPLGMATALAEFDAAGGFYGGSLIYASARDYARFGELYRLNGVWAGQRILPEGWVRFARTPTLNPSYGAGFWLETRAGVKPAGLMAGQGPLDAFAAQGHAGQVVMIIPSKAAVIVRLGLMPDDDAAWKRLGGWFAPVANALADL